MKPPVSPLLWLAPALALVLPPLLLVPLAFDLPLATFFKDIYEVGLWISPIIGIGVLAIIFRRRKTEPDLLRRREAFAALAFGCLAMCSPVFFLLLLVVLADH